MLHIEELSFAYQKETVLHEVSFRVKPGEILTILGPNGAGKSTLLKCIGGFLAPSQGQIELDENNIAHLGGRRLARRVAYLPQQLERCSQTVFDAVLLGRLPHRGQSNRSTDKERVDAVLKRLGLESLALRTLTQLSGGELQKVAIARALVQEPKLLLLDEPTSALDLANQVEILSLVRRLAAEQSLAVIMTMHDLSSALRFAHRFLLLRGGAVHAHGDVAHIDAQMIESAYGVAVDLHHHQGCPLVVPRAMHATESKPEPICI